MAVAKNKKLGNRTVKNELAKEDVEKLDRLLVRYGIKQGDYRSLALRLANDHIRGFRAAPLKLKHGDYGAVVRDKGGRLTDWTPEKLAELAAAVDEAKRKYGLSTDDVALRHIAKSGKWARSSNRGLDQWIKTLKNTLSIARRFQRDFNDLLEKVEELKRENPEN
jgi:hypothetical protein